MPEMNWLTPAQVEWILRERGRGGRGEEIDWNSEWGIW